VCDWLVLCYRLKLDLFQADFFRPLILHTHTLFHALSHRRGLEDHLEELMGRPSSHLLRRRHEREILTEYYRMKSEGKMCSERLGAVSRQSSYEECQRAARAAAEDAIVAANDQNTYSILYRPETTTTGTTSSAVHKRSRSMSPTTSTKTAEKHVSFMDSLQGMVSCGVGYE
jgi:hypothetical protein